MMLRAAAVAAAVLCSVVPAVAADPLSYDDPGMHFQAPAGWERIPIASDQNQDGAPVAAYVLRKGHDAQRTIIVMIDQFDGTLDAFTTQRTQDLRKGSSEDSSTFILKNEKRALDNGMPITFLEWTASLSSGLMTKTYEELIIDGQRSIDVRVSGLASDINDEDAKAALKDLYVVAYPRGRPTP